MTTAPPCDDEDSQRTEAAESMSLQTAAKRKKPLGTWAVVRHLPATRIAYVFSMSAIVIGNLSTFALYQFSDRLFNEWIRWLDPTIRSMSRFIPTLRGFTEHIEKTWAIRDIDLLRSALSLDWLLLVPFLAALLLCVLLDFRRNTLGVSSALWAEIRSRGRSMSWARVSVIGAFSIVAIGFFYSGAEFGGGNDIYGPLALLVTSFICVGAVIVCPLLTLIYSLLLLAKPRRAEV